MDSERLFRLSVWRPARLSRTVDYHSAEDGDRTYVFEFQRLQEQVYVWDPEPNDVFASLDEDAMKQFRSMLLDNFAPTLDPAKRSVARLVEVVDTLNTKLNEMKTIPWASSPQLVCNDEGEEANLFVNAPLALLNHLRWVSRVFEHVPGASVTFR